MYLLIIIMYMIYNAMTSVLNKNFQILGNELLYLVEVFIILHNTIILK